MIDLNELFDGETNITLNIKGTAVRYHFVEKTSAIDQEYLRRASNIKVRNGKAEPTEQSLTADLWLFDKLCTKVEVLDGANGSGESETRNPAPETWVDIADFRERLKPDSKRVALNFYNQRIARGDEDGAGN